MVSNLSLKRPAWSDDQFSSKSVQFDLKDVQFNLNMVYVATRIPGGSSFYRRRSAESDQQGWRRGVRVAVSTGAAVAVRDPNVGVVVDRE